MQIRVGFDMSFECRQPTPTLLMVQIHPSRSGDMVVPDTLHCEPAMPVREILDLYGNRCRRILLPAGRGRLWSDAVLADAGLADPACPDACQHDVADLPDSVLPFLLGSRYCETDRLSQAAWARFAQIPPGWARVQAICDFVNAHVSFGYQYARPTQTAWDVFNRKCGVCRDFSHLAITLCRGMNIPARYCTGYLPDIGLPPEPPDFHSWFEAYLGGGWHSFDARYNRPRIGRILMARGRDAADVAICTTFNPHKLTSFTVWAEERK